MTYFLSLNFEKIFSTKFCSNGSKKNNIKNLFFFFKNLKSFFFIKSQNINYSF